AARAHDMGISENELIGARSRGTLLMRMHRYDVDHIMGEPDDAREYVNGNRRCESLWYQDGGGWHTRITMCNGRLQSYST
ncbi:hypothetical protein SB717_39085, partial [Priestia sp. SIMBA_032]|uniref:hypothetical protein n=1 Tax=Priestia sp. SIMBA_032 TaxID=3085775 RepID=UPI003979101E